MSDVGSVGGSAPSSKPYDVTEYADNWSLWKNYQEVPYPTIPDGVQGEVGFAVVNPNGTFNTQYPLGPGASSTQGGSPGQGAPPGCHKFAVGGWNNSQPGSGLYEVLQPGNTQAQQTLINTIVAAANGSQGYKYSTVTLDYESFGATSPEQVAAVNAFVQNLSTALHDNNPPIKLEMAISPNPTNQQYYTLSAVAPCVDTFQVMTYDYERGLTAPMTVGDNASISSTVSYIQQLQQAGVPDSKIAIGVPFYGIQYQLGPNASAADVSKALASGTQLQAVSYSPDQQSDPSIANDDLYTEIGKNWDAPQAPWSLMTAHDGAQYYYNSSTHVLVNAMTPSVLQKFADTMKTQFPGITQVFGYEAYQGISSGMMTLLRDAFNSSKQ